MPTPKLTITESVSPYITYKSKKNGKKRTEKKRGVSLHLFMYDCGAPETVKSVCFDGIIGNIINWRNNVRMSLRPLWEVRTTNQIKSN